MLMDLHFELVICELLLQKKTIKYFRLQYLRLAFCTADHRLTVKYKMIRKIPLFEEEHQTVSSRGNT